MFHNTLSQYGLNYTTFNYLHIHRLERIMIVNHIRYVNFWDFALFLKSGLHRKVNFWVSLYRFDKNIEIMAAMW